MKAQKLTWVLSVIIAAGIFNGCDGLFDDSGLSILSEYSEVVLTVPPTLAGQYTFSEDILSSHVDSIISRTNTSNSSIKSIDLIEAEAGIAGTGEPGTNFNAFKTVNLNISTSNVPGMIIAKVSEVPKGANTISMDLQNENVTQYFNEDVYYVTVSGLLNEDIKDPLNIIIRLRYRINLEF